MNAQLKYSFKKESALFFRRYHFLAMMLAIFGMAVFSPLMLKAMIAMGTMAQDLLPTQTAQIAVPNGADPSMTDFMDMFASAAMSFAYTLGEFAATSLLIIMIVIRSAAGTEKADDDSSAVQWSENEKLPAPEVRNLPAVDVRRDVFRRSDGGRYLQRDVRE